MMRAGLEKRRRRRRWSGRARSLRRVAGLDGAATQSGSKRALLQTFAAAGLGARNSTRGIPFATVLRPPALAGAFLKTDRPPSRAALLRSLARPPSANHAGADRFDGLAVRCSSSGDLIRRDSFASGNIPAANALPPRCDT